MPDPFEAVFAVGEANTCLCLDLAAIGWRHARGMSEIGGAAARTFADQVAAAQPGAAPDLDVELAGGAIDAIMACRVQTGEAVEKAMEAWRARCQAAVVSADGEVFLIGMMSAFWTPALERAEKLSAQVAAPPNTSDGASEPT
jgi:hypothetical protein